MSGIAEIFTKGNLFVSNKLPFTMYPRAESNRNRQNRNLKFYPLNYGGKRDTNVVIFTEYGAIWPTFLFFSYSFKEI